MNLLIAFALMGTDPVVAPWDFEAQLKSSPTIVAMQSDIASLKSNRSTVAAGTCPCGPNCPCCAACPGKQMPVVGATNVAPAPTYHYAPGTTCRIENGAVVCGGQPIAVTYPDNPTVTVPLQTSTPFLMSGPSTQVPFTVLDTGGGFTGGCAGGNCGAPQGRRGLFGRRR